MHRGLVQIGGWLAIGVNIVWPACFVRAQTSNPSGSRVNLVVHTESVVKTVSRGIYGQFLEHIYNSVHGGLWGDQILNGTLELRPPRGGRATSQPSGAVAPFFWELFGSATIRNEAENPFNGQSCLRIIGTETNTFAGIRQKPIALVHGESYSGSLYLRGSAGIVRLQYADEQGGPVFTKDFATLTPQWQKFTLEFIPARNVDNAVLSIGLVGAGDVCVDQISVFSKSALATGGFRPDLLKAIADLKPASIRWPGGSFANSYIWQNGIGPVEKRISHPVEVWGDRDPMQFGTDEFMRLCEKVGADPVLVINTARGVDDALNWLEYCLGDANSNWGKVRAANGRKEPYHLDVIEIDNETWLLMDKPKYIDIVRRFSAAIRAKYPKLKLSVCGSYAFDDGTGEGRAEWHNAGWDQTMLDEVSTNFDVLSPHYYNGLLDKADYIDNPRIYESRLVDICQRIKKSGNPNIKLYVSEWNLTSREWGNDWRVGLYAGGILNAFERQSDLVVMSCPALFMRRTWATAWNNALINFDHRTWFPAGNYVVMKLFRESYAPSLLALDGPEKPLNITATKSDDQKTVYLKAVNPEGFDVDVDVALDGRFVPQSATMQIIAPGSETARNTLDRPDQIKPASHDVQLTGRTIRFHMPAQSVGVVKANG